MTLLVDRPGAEPRPGTHHAPRLKVTLVNHGYFAAEDQTNLVHLTREVDVQAIVPAWLKVKRQRQVGRTAIDDHSLIVWQRPIPALAAQPLLSPFGKAIAAQENRAVDHVLCYALMKHVPYPVKQQILREFARVSTERMAVSFALFDVLSPLFWCLYGCGGYPITHCQLDDLATAASLKVGALYKVGLPVVGMETLVVLERTGQSMDFETDLRAERTER